MTTTDITSLPYRANVGIMLANPSGQIFVAQRLDYPGPAWQMPQGGIDPGEDPQAAALRELEEETGIAPNLVTIRGVTKDWITYDLPDDLVLKLWKGRWRGQKQLWYFMQFDGDDAQINIETEHPEFSHWKWTAPDELVANIVPFKRDVYGQVLAEFNDLLPAG